MRIGIASRQDAESAKRNRTAEETPLDHGDTEAREKIINLSLRAQRGNLNWEPGTAPQPQRGPRTEGRGQRLARCGYQRGDWEGKELQRCREDAFRTPFSACFHPQSPPEYLYLRR
jgi:hypothetical protein